MSMSFLQGTTNTSDLTAYTFSSQNLGDAAADRYIIVCAESRSGSTFDISTLTVGGVTATIIANSFNSSSNYGRAVMGIAAVPTGTTGDIVVTWSAGVVRCSIQVYRATELNSATPVDSDTSIADDPTVTLTVGNGFAIGACGTGTPGSATWTNLTEDYDTAPETNMTVSSASGATTPGSLEITCDFTGGATATGVFASWEFASVSSGSPHNYYAQCV